MSKDTEIGADGTVYGKDATLAREALSRARREADERFRRAVDAAAHPAPAATRTPKPCRFPQDGECHHKSYDKDCEEHGDWSAATPLSPLPTGSADRKAIPLWDGVMAYAPAALAEVARTSQKGNDKHNPGEPLHHARGKSADHKNCIARHLVDYEAVRVAVERGTLGLQDTLRLKQDNGTFIEITVLEWLREELGNMCWRVLMFTQEQLEQLGVAPLAPRARLPEGITITTLPGVRRTETGWSK